MAYHRPGMLRRELHYDLPPDLIAQHPIEPRDASRLLVLDRRTQSITHRHFRDVSEYLRPGDCLVVNDTRVIPARFFCRRNTGGRVEGLFLHERGGGWQVLLRPSARMRPGESLRLLSPPGAEQPVGDVRLILEARGERGEWSVRPEPVVAASVLLARLGAIPLPPYITRDSGPSLADAERYQTIFAERDGAVAAPTAGLHFTPALRARLQAAGVASAAVTLHVGAGTFLPLDCDALPDHRMHAERYELREEACAALNAARAGGGRLVAVGTTSVRVLETALRMAAGARSHATRAPAGGMLATGARLAASGEHGAPHGPRTADAGDPSEEGLAFEPASGWTDIFIYPPYSFRAVDALITNFHLPESTLLALVMALAGVELVRAAYAEAISQRYRFYSYGDAMLIV